MITPATASWKPTPAMASPLPRGYLGLGSNIGDPAAHLRAAIELLGEHGVKVEAVCPATSVLMACSLFSTDTPR